MTSIPLSTATIQGYGSQPRGCQEISKIHLEYDIDSDAAEIEARIPATTSNHGYYVISVRVQSDGSRILGTRCTCPVGGYMAKCKHVHKVLCRIAESVSRPISGPDQAHLAQVARRNRLVQQMQHASVYIAFACKSEIDSGSDFRRSFYVKDSFDQEVLGVFFSKKQANQCAKEYVQNELGHDIDEDEDDGDEEMSEDDDDDESFVFDGSDIGEYEDNAFDKVWVEQRAIEDASPRFHK